MPTIKHLSSRVGFTRAQLKAAKSYLASIAGSTTSEAKAKAARKNGKLGGRPKKKK